ncbi:MAG: SDR family NAD(P)-dependent oxidoreductase [Polyangiaceae bacterium]|nr:SDR family NAD(P)-dependent oxidoreductase [Polyangiaceae bacterium]
MTDPERTVLVTGASRGLGAETCRQLARRGYRVVVTSRGGEGEKVAAALAGGGLRVEHRPLDVEDPASVTRLAESLRLDGVRLDVVVNNAGVALDGFDSAVARRTIDVNYLGALRVTDALLERLRDGGAIVMVSSGMGEASCLGAALRRRFLDPRLTRAQLGELLEAFVRDVADGRHQAEGWPSSAYRVSKVGLNALTRQLAAELRGRGIRVNAVCPGWVRTDMGGPGAPRGVEEGAASIVWAATEPTGVTGGFHRDGVRIPW